MPRRALRVLLVEDNPVNQRVALGFLSKGGHKVSLAGNGCEALDALAASRYDLIFMDIQMPVMGGLDTIAAIRAEEQVRGGHQPIIEFSIYGAFRLNAAGGGSGSSTTGPGCSRASAWYTSGTR